MNDSKTMLFGIPRIGETQTQLPNLRVGWLDNLAVLYKISLIALVFVIGLLVVFLNSRAGFTSLRYHNDNLYNFVLIPITNLQEARILAINNVRTFEIFDPLNPLDAEDRQGVFEQADDYSKQINQILEKYQKEWISTANPEFSGVLKNTGKIKLQDSEVSQFGELQKLNQRLNTSLAKVSTAQKLDYDAVTELAGGYFEISDRLQDLISVNNDFAKLSADAANTDAATATRNEIIVLVLSLIIAGIVTFLVVRAITARLSTLERGARSLREGQMDLRIPVGGSDEIGSVANTLNASISQLKGLLNEQNLERQRGVKLQENVSEFLTVAMDIAGGDLTKKGAVTDDALGNVVDAINIMTDEFGMLLGNVRTAAERVSLSANSMTQTSQGILENAQSQVNLAQGAQTQTNLVAQAMQSLALTADKGATAAQFTLEASNAGTQAVTQTREQLVQIRSQMLEMTQGMQGLARRSDEINEVVRTISRFASQTNLLALGASLEAAGAGSAGARFGAVANAVRSLADDSAKAASRIGSIVKDVQNEIQALSSRAVVGAEQVQVGTDVATQASDRLARISDLALQSVQVAQDIASLASTQAESVDVVRENMTRIAMTAQATESNTRQGGVAAGELQSLSQGLAQSLERFRLPA